MTMMMGRTVAVLAVLALASVAPAQTATPKQMKVARKLIAKLKLVDGTGSGLDADTLQGPAPSAFLPAGAKASDADTLDGIDSSAFVQKSELPTSGKFSCAGTASFSIRSTDTFDTTSSERYPTGGFGIFRCNLALPEGVTVTALSCTVTDSDASNDATCEMWRTSAVDGTEDEVADGGTTTGTPGAVQLTTSTITNGTIDNAGYSYFVQSRVGGTGSVGLYGFNVTYSTAPAASPAAGTPAPLRSSSTD